MTIPLFTVVALTKNIKTLLEQRFSSIYVSGEISNLRIPVSGHYYFTLKDEEAQISAVMFRGQNWLLKFIPENGMKVIGLCRVTVYEPRGNYQIIFETLEPKGVGSWQIAFEQIKKRLAAEGVFDAVHKKPIPLLPAGIGLITSPTGAVVHDFIDIAARRFPGVNIFIVPVKVQGDEAVSDIAAALSLSDMYNKIEVIVLARGGGSLEDLQAFNTETVVRAVFACKTPVVSAIGHETDVTLTDFAADLRAPTPSAAAELVVPQKEELRLSVLTARARLENNMNRRVTSQRSRIRELNAKLNNPKKRLYDLRLRLDDFTITLQKILPALIYRQRERLNWTYKSLNNTSPLKQMPYIRDKLNYHQKALTALMFQRLTQCRTQLNEFILRHSAHDPDAVLKRGYSIARTLPEGVIIQDPKQAPPGQKLSITVKQGTIIARAEQEQGH